MTSYVLSLAGGYLVGSIPIGYLLVKRRLRLDLRKSGSGNVGALNAGVVSGSKALGITVGLLDGIKGLLVVIAAWLLADAFWPVGLALLGAVIGHNYPVWLKFRGGRGLATACGGFFGIGVGYTIVWCTLWSILKWQRKSILVSNTVATIATPVMLMLLPATAIDSVMVGSVTPAEYRLFSLCLSVLLLLSHRDVLKEAQEEDGS